MLCDHGEKLVSVNAVKNWDTILFAKIMHLNLGMFILIKNLL